MNSSSVEHFIFGVTVGRFQIYLRKKIWNLLGGWFLPPGSRKNKVTAAFQYELGKNWIETFPNYKSKHKKVSVKLFDRVSFTSFQIIILI